MVTQHTMSARRSSGVLLPMDDISAVTADEAYTLLKVQFERLLALLESLGPADWSQPTLCTQWNVRDMVAHQAGSYASGTGYGEMVRQYMVIPGKGQLPEDAVNARQLAERAGRSPAELIAELRMTGPRAIQKWAREFRLMKLLAIPHPVPGVLTMRHLMWVLHSRDTWMHRLDICRATGRAFEQTPEQDGRIAALVMRDAAKALRRRLGRVDARFDLSGVAGGQWRMGAGEPAATIHMDALDFCTFASGRFDYAAARARATLSGDAALAETILKNLLVLF